MRIAIVGLGLIGGSLAKAFSELDDITVLGCDADAGVISAARLVGAIDRELTVQDLKSADFVFISLYPGATVDYLEKNAQYIGKNTTVVDCTGVKKDVCEKAFETAKRYGFCFIGCHPMAGTQFSGFAHSRATLFKGADMIAVPKKDEEIEKLQALKELLVKIGFRSLTITTAEKHDEIIAFTSQLAHVVSNAYVKSPNARVHKGFSAGSYKDLTRVARLNPEMWTELFLANADNLTFEIDLIVENLKKYSDALKNRDGKELMALLDEGSKLKGSID